MVTIADGRFELPEKFYYSKTQHVYLDKDKKLIGLDQIGYAFLNNPKSLKILTEEEVSIGEPFAVITTKNGITTLISPCSGKITQFNEDALSYMENETYSKGFILKMETISEIDPYMLTGVEEIQKWAKHEVWGLMRSMYSFKIIMIGDSATGKTAIKVRFTDDYFKKDLKTTLGVDFGSKEVSGEYFYPFRVLYRFKAKMNVWDAAGQAHFEKIRGMYYKDAKGAILVYDVNNPVSFKNLEKWVEELEENAGKRVPVLLIGNKSDLERKVSVEDAEAFSDGHNYLFYEVSAKTGEGIEDIFKLLALEIFKNEEGLT